ncbi:MAG: N-acetylmuramoyl-L-alanine amidase [Candidatus Nanopelagicales bacterium]
MNQTLAALPGLQLSSGAMGPAVAEVRDRLARLGLLRVNVGSPDPVDVFDANLDAAVRVFQQQRGITVDGVVGPKTFRRIEEARWNLGDRVISFTYGHLTAGDDIAELQRRLNSLGFDPGRIDGIFGPDTDSAVREFQRNVGIDVDGTCGPQMWRELDRLNRTVTGGTPQQLRSDHYHSMAKTGAANKVVVLDPGHGGPDYGHVGHRLAESIVADDVSRRIEGRLAAIGTQVLVSRPMSHEMDQEVDESARAQFANDNGADLVVSLHVDAEPTGNAGGISTYYFGHDEDRSVLGQRFADTVQAEIVRRTDLTDCRTHAKTWDLLRMTRMPAVRVEFGYVSSAHDASRLSEATFRDVIAEAIAGAVVRHFTPETDTE